MNANHPAQGHRPASLSTVTLAALTLLLAACAQVPDLGPKVSLADAEQIAHQPAFDNGQSLWPNQPWWERYGDAQLNGIVEEALRDAPSMAVALARLKQAAAVAEQQGANLKPSVQANVSVSSQRQSYNNGFPAAYVPQGWNDYGRAALELSYDLDWWGRNHAALAAATSNWQAAQAEAAQAHVTLSANLVQAYADLARLHAQLDTAEQAVQVRAQTVRLFQERQSNGLETLGSVKQVQARQAQAEGDRLALKESLVTQRNLIAALMGRSPERGIGIQRPTVDLSQIQGLPSQLEVNLIGRRPDLVAARLRAQASARQIDAAEAGFYPNVNISAVIGAQSLGLDMLTKPGSRIGSIGPAISLPLFDQGRLQGQYKQANAQYEEAVAQYKQAISQALQDVADVANSEQALAGRLAQAQAAVDASRQAWQIAHNRYEGGLATYIEVLSAEDSLLSMQRELTNLQSRLFSLDVSLVRALGGGYQHKAI